MKKIVYLISLFGFLFLLNLIIFLSNDNYKNFLKTLKYSEQTLNITDDYIAVFDEKKCNCPVCEVCQKCEIKDELVVDDYIIEENNLIKNDDNKLFENTEVVYDDYIFKILSLFEEKYVLSNKPYNEYNLIFDLTDEYPYEYQTYFGNDIELYFYSNNNYNEIYEMFDYLKNDLKVSLNKNNTFGEKSFFINKNIDDGYFRINIYANNILFGLKAKKSYYNDIKNILSKI